MLHEILVILENHFTFGPLPWFIALPIAIFGLLKWRNIRVRRRIVHKFYAELAYASLHIHEQRQKMNRGEMIGTGQQLDPSEALKVAEWWYMWGSPVAFAVHLTQEFGKLQQQRVFSFMPTWGWLKYVGDRDGGWARLFHNDEYAEVQLHINAMNNDFSQLGYQLSLQGALNHLNQRLSTVETVIARAQKNAWSQG